MGRGLSRPMERRRSSISAWPALGPEAKETAGSPGRTRMRMKVTMTTPRRAGSEARRRAPTRLAMAFSMGAIRAMRALLSGLYLTALTIASSWPDYPGSPRRAARPGTGQSHSRPPGRRTLNDVGVTGTGPAMTMVASSNEPDSRAMRPGWLFGGRLLRAGVYGPGGRSAPVFANARQLTLPSACRGWLVRPASCRGSRLGGRTGRCSPQWTWP